LNSAAGQKENGRDGRPFPSGVLRVKKRCCASTALRWKSVWTPLLKGAKRRAEPFIATVRIAGMWTTWNDEAAD
jgi:hypothetical protein